MNSKDGGPAFPIVEPNEPCAVTIGMTLRDYFAAKALPSIFTDYCAIARIDGWDQDWRQYVALESYEIADAMLKAREKQ